MNNKRHEVGRVNCALRSRGFQILIVSLFVLLAVQGNLILATACLSCRRLCLDCTPTCTRRCMDTWSPCSDNRATTGCHRPSSTPKSQPSDKRIARQQTLRSQLSLFVSSLSLAPSHALSLLTFVRQRESRGTLCILVIAGIVTYTLALHFLQTTGPLALTSSARAPCCCPSSLLELAIEYRPIAWQAREQNRDQPAFRDQMRAYSALVVMYREESRRTRDTRQQSVHQQGERDQRSRRRRKGAHQEQQK